MEVSWFCEETRNGLITCSKASCLEVRRANHTTCLTPLPPLSEALDGFSKINLSMRREMNTVTRVHYKLVEGKLRQAIYPVVQLCYRE